MREFSPLAVEDEDAGIVPWPKEQDAGGYGTFKMQAECPFQAFATMRLNARELDRADWGLDPAERGQLVHRALEGVWGEIKDRDTLINAKAAGRLREIIEAHVHRALARYGRRETTRNGRRSASRRMRAAPATANRRNGVAPISRPKASVW